MKHAQLKMHCSRFNSNLFELHVTESPSCISSHDDIEDVNHYLLACPLYVVDRRKLLSDIQNIANIDINMGTI